MKFELSLNKLADQGVSNLNLCMVYRRPVAQKSIVVKIAGWDTTGRCAVKGAGIHMSSTLDSLYFYAPPRETPGPVVLPEVTFATMQSLVVEPVQWPSGSSLQGDKPFDVYASVRTRHGETEIFSLVRFEEDK